MMRCMPVSYTHLDVYKRQALAGITPEYCAGYALKQMKRRKVLIVPTTEIKAATICGRFIPQNLLIAITAHQQKKKLKAEDI